MPITSFYKTQIFNLARYLNLPSYIIEKSPSPDLIPGIIDEDMLGISYEKLDLILFGIENNYSLDKIMSILNAEEADVLRVKEIIKKSEYLRKWPITL
jgi:NAD+ synthase